MQMTNEVFSQMQINSKKKSKLFQVVHSLGASNNLTMSKVYRLCAMSVCDSKTAVRFLPSTGDFLLQQ